MNGSVAPGTPCVPDAREYATLQALPHAARALFGQDAFSTLDWYETIIRWALPPGASACFHVVGKDDRVAAVVPLLRHGRHLSALTTPYTCFWQPLLAEGANPEAVGIALASLWRRHAVIRLDCTDDGPIMTGIAIGLRRRGLHSLFFDHFGDWHLPTPGTSYEAYLAARPGQLRHGIVRHTRRLIQNKGATFTLVTGEPGLEAAIAVYETVYAASWKEPEPSPHFNPMLMRRAAAAGTLRLGLLHLAGQPIAAQFWLKHGNWAVMLKVAYDEAYATLSPGNVLSGQILQHLLDQEHITEFDFGRGDDAYKQDWTGERRQRRGVLVANPLTAGGAVEILRKKASSPFLKKRTKKLLFG